MKVDVLVCEIGSTTTVVNAFDLTDNNYVGQGMYKTTVDSDVTIGVSQAIENLKENLGIDELEYDELLATSSAAGGLKMTVHGLVHDMTVTAAYEAAVGAGANIELVTSGKLRRSDLKKLEEINPNIILIAGGVDYGERDTALYNAQIIAKLKLNIPVIYAGNYQNIEDVRLIFDDFNQLEYLKITENVYPRIDQLNVTPTRSIIHDTFEEHIVHAKGMEKIYDYVTSRVIPTPGAVLKASELLYEEYGNLICFDIGGATTDLHSVSEDSEEISKILANPQPKSKRTVEGDLGVYVNKLKVVGYIGDEELAKKLNVSVKELNEIISNYHVIPKNDLEIKLVTELAKKCVTSALKRHAGSISNQYLSGGASKVAFGKDLTGVNTIICTGGVLTKLSAREEIINSIFTLNSANKLYPSSQSDVLFDNHYIMASVGVLSLSYPEAALEILKKSFRNN
ncbi:MAG: GlmL-related ornithine degradation protein [Bacilli bacterium]